MTLVVRNHFSQIVFFTRADLEDESIVDIRDGGVIKHRNGTSDIGSKIIITSRSDKIARLGTTPPLLPKEAYWYFFKVCTFGSMDASEHPEIASVAMELAMESERSFMVANVFGRLLRSNTNTLYWRLVLASLREFKKKI
uniref:NB-ARC domain-containing protein n=1 Tax=Oryza nivara TaxID=4536 RepID=A0A0E0ITN9_ORYNI